MKTKIILLLLSVVFFSTSILLFMVITTFKKDKISYVYEVITSQTASIANQLNTELESLGLLSLGLSQKNNAQQIINDSKYLKYFSVIQKIESKNEIVTDFTSSEFIKDESQIQKLTDEFENLSVVDQKILFSNDKLVYQIVLNQLIPNKVATLFVFESEVANQIVSSQKNDQYTFVFSNALQLVIGDTSAVRQFGQYLERKVTKKWAESETGLIKNSNNENWIYSSSPILGADLIVINFVSEKKAFSVLKQIYFKSFFSLILILSLVVIIGIISATYLTEKLKSLTAATQKVIAGDFESEVIVSGSDEISMLSVDFNHMVKQIKRLMSETAEQARMENELKTAQLVQENLFPPESHSYSNCTVVGYCKPATECGGDWWFHSEDNDSVNIIIADATGHGVPAALMTSAIKSAFVLTSKLKLTSEETITKINEALCEVGRNKVMMTAFYIRINKKTNSAEYINSSHEAPFILDINSDVVDKNNFVYLNDKVSARLGQSSETIFTAIPIQLKSKQRLFLYTDGIFDLKNSDDKKLTERLFHRKVTEIANEKTDIHTYSKNIRNFIFDYHTHKNLEDDVTLCHIEIS